MTRSATARSRCGFRAHRWGLPEDLKGTVIYLASGAADYVSGAIIPIDGGYLGR